MATTASPSPTASPLDPMRRLFRLLSLGGRLLASTAVILALVVLLGIGLGPRTGKFQVRTVLTGSMRPTMPEGSVVMIRPVPTSELGVGDVITYKIPVHDRRIVTHRIVEIIEPAPEPVVRTKGDANDAPDPWVAKLRGDRAWRVRLAVPRVGYALAALRHPASRRLTVLAAPALLALVSLVGIWSPAKTGDEPRSVAEKGQEATRDRPASEKRGRPPAPRPLTDQERWQEWRERRVLQRPVGQTVLDNGRQEPRAQPSPEQAAPQPEQAPRQLADHEPWQEWQGLTHNGQHEPPAHRPAAREPRRQPARTPRQLTEQQRWQEWRERRVLQRPVGGRIRG
jgi:signal peptidase I